MDIWVKHGYPHFYYGYIMIYANHQNMGGLLLYFTWLNKWGSNETRGTDPSSWGVAGNVGGMDRIQVRILCYSLGWDWSRICLSPKLYTTYSYIFPIDFHGETSPIQVAVESERRTPRAKAAAAEQMAREMAHPRKGTLRLQTVSSIKLRKEKQGESIICGCMVGNANPE
jgi:hypothetical protein